MQSVRTSKCTKNQSIDSKKSCATADSTLMHFLGLLNKIDQIRTKEEQEVSQYNPNTRTASKKRIEQFINKVNSEILENKEMLEKQRRIKDLKEEIELQKIRNKRYISQKIYEL